MVYACFDLPQMVLADETLPIKLVNFLRIRRRLQTSRPLAITLIPPTELPSRGAGQNVQDLLVSNFGSVNVGGRQSSQGRLFRSGVTGASIRS
jgi:hypothetical protein